MYFTQIGDRWIVAQAKRIARYATLNYNLRSPSSGRDTVAIDFEGTEYGVARNITTGVGDQLLVSGELDLSILGKHEEERVRDRRTM
jgi:hypothetical protein